MRITRLYHPGTLHCGSTTQLDKNTSSHLVRVLRTKIKSPVVLFNGDGYDYSCLTLDDNHNKTLLSIESKAKTNTESNLSITLIQGLSRQDRMETTIQKSVELGVTKIIPVLCQRSNTRLTEEKKIRKLEHWRNVAISACEQSGRSIIPEISDISPFSHIKSLLDSAALKIMLNPEASSSLKNTVFNGQTIEVFIGPEGGLDEDEIAFLHEHQFTNNSFGPRILRTETAGPAVISALQLLWGDF